MNSPKKILVIRLSSMGDVILSTAFLESLPSDTQVDWLISRDFAFILENHPRIRKLHVYDKKTGLGGWLRMIADLSKETYDQRVDLHVTLRSQVARIAFRILDTAQVRFIPWRKISKQRFQFFGYLLFKKFWPSMFRPTPFWQRFSKLAGGEIRTPSMRHLLGNQESALSKYELSSKKYFVVMPSSRWQSKEWGADSYLELCESIFKKNGFIPVVLGRQQDQSAVKLVEGFRMKNIQHRAVLSENDFSITASLIHHSIFYVGSDTGLAHLAEAVGTRAYMIFGPTRPDLGFGPWKPDSASIHSDVACAPCSKDGRICYRITEPYACLKRISVKQVEGRIQ